MQHNQRKREPKETKEDPKIKVIRTTLGIGPGYDDNVIDSTTGYLENILAGKQGTKSGFAVSIMEIILVEGE
jgi:hypothetical protein